MSEENGTDRGPNRGPNLALVYGFIALAMLAAIAIAAMVVIHFYNRH